MTPAWARAVCRLLIALAICGSYSSAQAGLIATADALQPGPARATLHEFLGRADVARQLQVFGLDAASAKDRVAALSDEEVRSLAGRINALPAGADVAGILLLVVIVALIWWAWKR
jgi:hypothetical protein